jgi:hypothetical protein
MAQPAPPPPPLAPPYAQPPPAGYGAPPAQPPYPGQPYYAAPPSPPKKKHGPLYWIAVAIGVIVLVVIVLVIVSAALIVSTGGANTVAVSAINITSGDNACGANGHSEPGFTTSGGGSVQETITVNGGILFSCTVNSVSVSTSGFSLSGANTPLNVPAGGSQSLSFTIHAPNANYNGVLTIDIE